MRITNLKIKSSLYNYEVNFINDFSKTLQRITNGISCTFVVDKNVYNIYKDKLRSIAAGNIFLIDAIESKKNIDTVLELINFWAENNVKKNYKVICIGGGITQDIVSFSSSMYLRNIEWLHFPTTLLSMCDSCIGGKSGINLNEYKNQLGVFYPPKCIFIDKTFLNSLHKTDIINGWGEILKLSLTEKKDFFEKLSMLRDFIRCPEIDLFIYRGLLVKKHIIEKDEFENDLRRVLNYGHTFGHALEAYSNNTISHGLAVIWGIDVVNYIAFRKNILKKDIYLRIKSLIKKYFIPYEIIIDDPAKLFKIIFKDKKVKDNIVYFALLKKLSRLVIYPIELDDGLKSIFNEYLRETHEYYSRLVRKTQTKGLANLWFEVSEQV